MAKTEKIDQEGKPREKMFLKDDRVLPGSDFAQQDDDRFRNFCDPCAGPDPLKEMLQDSESAVKNTSRKLKGSTIETCCSRSPGVEGSDGTRAFGGEALNILGNEEDEEPQRNQIYNIQKGERSRGIWKKIEAAVDSGAVDIVGNPQHFPDAIVKECSEACRACIF